VLAHFFRASDALVNGDRQLNGELIGHQLDLDHYIPYQGADAGIAHHLYQRSAGERADGIEGDIAQQLYPNFVAAGGR
jgi:hypothetical protein